MYLDYFKLKEEPFNLTPDPDYLFLSESHQEALARIQFGIERHKGFIVLTGEVGSGKTTVVRTYMQNHPPDQKIALIVNTKVTSKNLLQNICKDFGIKADYHKLSKDGILNLLYDFILKNSFYGINLVVIIDEAHDLGIQQLEEVRLLTNLETNTQKLLQVVLVGQPELWDLLNMPELRALKQRIHVQYHLKPLTFAETQKYILFRLKKAGYQGKGLFTPEAIQKIYQISGGIPRVINVVCSNAMVLAFSMEKKKIDVPIIEEVGRELSPPVPPAAPDRPVPEDREQPEAPKNVNICELKWNWWKILLFFLLFSGMMVGLNIISFYIIYLFGLF